MLRKTLLTLSGVIALAASALADPDHSNPYPFGSSDYAERARESAAAAARDQAFDKRFDREVKEDAEMREWESHMVTPRLYSDPFPKTERDPHHNSGGITLFGFHF
jgi:hypothetical protein